MHTLSIVFLLLLVVCGVIAHESASSSCEFESSSSDSCTNSGSVGSASVASAVSQFDPHAPIPIEDFGEAPRLTHLWTTPLFVSQPKLRDASNFNRILSNRALAAFEYIRKREEKKALAASKSADHSAARGDSDAGFNERFFQWQQEQHALGSKAETAYQKLTASQEFKSILHLFSSYAISYLEAAGKTPEWIAEHTRTLTTTRGGGLFCWATVARDGSFHMSHTHPDHMLSGVYYSRVPESGAGSLVFDDPRGPRWPFDGRYIHVPAPGQLIMFPSWLVHQVTPTLSVNHEARVSWSCNIQGSWEGLSDVNLG